MFIRNAFAQAVGPGSGGEDQFKYPAGRPPELFYRQLGGPQSYHVEFVENYPYIMSREYQKLLSWVNPTKRNTYLTVVDSPFSNSKHTTSKRVLIFSTLLLFLIISFAGIKIPVLARR